MEMNKRTAKSDIVLIVTVCLLIAAVRRHRSGPAEKKMITIKGSDTMVHLVSNWAEEFMKHEPER